MSKRVKEIISGHLSSRFEDLNEAVLIDFAGLTAEESRSIRASLRAHGISMNVVKNTLVSRVFTSRGLEFPENWFRGPTAIVWGDEDAIAAAKSVAEWRKKNRKSIRIKGGLLEGQPLGAAEAEQLTKVPSVPELRQMVVSVIASPLTGIVGLVNNILGGLPNVLKAIADKREGE